MSGHPVIVTVGIGLAVLVAIGWNESGNVTRPDGTVDPGATLDQSFDSGMDEASKAAGRGVDKAVDGAADSLAEAAMESNVIKGTLAVTGGVVAGTAGKKLYDRWAQQGLPDPGVEEAWCQEATEDGEMQPCREDTEPAEGPVFDLGEPPVVVETEPEPAGGPVFDLGKPPVLEDAMDLGELPVFNLDEPTLPGYVVDFGR